MAPRKSPRDAKCKHCGRYFTKGGLKQHMRHVKCSPTSTASPRKFERVRCKHCSKSLHSTSSICVHVSTVHPKEYATLPGLMEYHRAPHVKQKHSGAERKDKEADPSRPGHGLTRAAERSSSPPVHTDDHYSNHRSKRRESSRQRRDHHLHTISVSDITSGGPQQATKPAWHRKMNKIMAEAADHK